MAISRAAFRGSAPSRVKESKSRNTPSSFLAGSVIHYTRGLGQAAVLLGFCYLPLKELEDLSEICGESLPWGCNIGIKESKQMHSLPCLFTSRRCGEIEIKNNCKSCAA